MKAGGQAQQPRQQVQPLLLGQAQIEQGRLERPASQEIEGLGAVAGLDRLVSEHLQRHAERASQARVIVNHEDVHNTPLVKRPRMPFGRQPAIVHFARPIVQSAMPRPWANSRLSSRNPLQI